MTVLCNWIIFYYKVLYEIYSFKENTWNITIDENIYSQTHIPKILFHVLFGKAVFQHLKSTPLNLASLIHDYQSIHRYLSIRTRIHTHTHTGTEAPTLPVTLDTRAIFVSTSSARVRAAPPPNNSRTLSWWYYIREGHGERLTARRVVPLGARGRERSRRDSMRVYSISVYLARAEMDDFRFIVYVYHCVCLLSDARGILEDSTRQ